jgi:DNA-binding transcriptional MerR regulator
MTPPPDDPPADPPMFDVDPDARYSIEVMAEITGVSTRTILHYQEAGLIAPAASHSGEPVHFDDEAVRTLRRIEHLRGECGMSLAHLKLILSLLDEIERLRGELRARG